MAQEEKRIQILSKFGKFAKQYQDEIRREYLLSKGVVNAINNPENGENEDNIQEACKMAGILFNGGIDDLVEYLDSKKKFKKAKEDFYKALGDVIDNHSGFLEKQLIVFKQDTIDSINKSVLFRDSLNDSTKNSRSTKPMME